MNRYYIGNLVWAFQRHQNEPQVLPHFGVKNAKKREKLTFSLSNDKTLLQSCSDQQLPAALLFVYNAIVKQFTKSMHIYAFSTISVHPSLWRYGSMCSKRCISETTAPTCMLDSVKIGGKFISRIGAKAPACASHCDSCASS